MAQLVINELTGKPLLLNKDFLVEADGDARYLQILNDLSDLNDIAIARTNLGLVAGGAGDIWVEKAGDTITGQLLYRLDQKGRLISEGNGHLHRPQQGNPY